MKRSHAERHKSHRGAWLRASVLGANDGIVSTASLVLGVAAAEADQGAIVTAGVAGLIAGALSMAVGEFVSVSSQRDTEDADIAVESREHAASPEHELEELVAIYVKQGLSAALARQVAVALTERDALKVHLAEELGIREATRARPVQAAMSSALAFAAGAVLPLLAVGLAAASLRVPLTVGISAVALGALGALGAWLGGAPVGRASVRVVLGGLLAMALTMGIGRLVGTTLG